jgi:hypothetical protein
MMSWFLLLQQEVAAASIDLSAHPASIEQDQLFCRSVSQLNVQMPLLIARCRKGGRLMTVQREAFSKKSQDNLNVRILCIPPYVPRLESMASGVKKTKYDISLLYELIL